MSVELAQAQRALIKALTGVASYPHGFDPVRIQAVRDLLLRKRMAGVRRAWPQLPVVLDSTFEKHFAYWAPHNPFRGGFADGYGFACSLRRSGVLPPVGLQLLAAQQVLWRDRGDMMRLRRLPALRFAAGSVFVQVCGRSFRLG